MNPYNPQPHGVPERIRLAIVGGGPAGYTAAIYGARALLAPVLFEGWQPGGQLTITSDVENWPGDASVGGPDLTDRMREHALAAGADLRHHTITGIARADGGGFLISGEGGIAWLADAVVVATGAVAKWLGIPGEQELLGYGVSACATCDGFFFRGKTVTVVGGGNTAMEEALFLSRLAKDVVLVHRRDALRGERILQRRIAETPNIRIVWNTTPRAVEGDPAGQGVTGLKTDGPDGPRTIPCDGVFVAIGHAPASGILQGLADIRPDGTVVTEPGSSRTSVPGLFAAGDVTDSRYRQAVTSAGMGCMAALDAERWLAERSGG